VALGDCGESISSAARSTVPTEGPAAEPTARASARGNVRYGARLTLAEALSILKPGRQPAAPFAPDERAIAAEVNGEPIYFSEITPRGRTRLAADPSGANSDRTPADRLQRCVRNCSTPSIAGLICQEARRSLSPHEFARVAYRRRDDGTRFRHRGLRRSRRRTRNGWPTNGSSGTSRSRIPAPGPSCFAYYRANSQKYQEPQWVRWEQASARFERFPSPEHAAAAVTFLRSSLVRQPSEPPGNVNLDALEVQTIDWTRCTDLPHGVVVQTLTHAAHRRGESRPARWHRTARRACPGTYYSGCQVVGPRSQRPSAKTCCKPAGNARCKPTCMIFARVPGSDRPGRTGRQCIAIVAGSHRGADGHHRFGRFEAAANGRAERRRLPLSTLNVPCGAKLRENRRAGASAR